MTVVRMLVGIENNDAIEKGMIGSDRTGYLPVPKLQSTSPLFLPAFVEIEEDVDSSMGLEFVVPVEVGMDLQKVATRAQMGTAPNEVRVRNEIVDAGQCLEEKN